MNISNAVGKVAIGAAVGCVVVVAATQIANGYRTLKQVAKLGLAAYAIKEQFDKIIADNHAKDEWATLVRTEVLDLWTKATAEIPVGSYTNQVRDDLMFTLEDAIADASAVKAATPSPSAE